MNLRRRKAHERPLRQLPLSRETVVRDSLLSYLKRNPGGLTSDRMLGWLQSRREGYTLQEVEAGFLTLRDEGIAACTNGVWWLRDNPGIVRNIP